MVVAFTKKALRAMQDALQIYKAVLTEYAAFATERSILSPLRPPFLAEFRDMVEMLLGSYSLVRDVAICHTAGVASAVLVQ